MASTTKPSRLGKGLSSLMGRPVQVLPPTPPPSAAGPHQASEAPPAAENSAAGPAASETSAAPPANELLPGRDGIHHLAVDLLRPNPHQPRQNFDEAALRRLADSIRADGLMQPVIVRPATSQKDGPEDGGARRYELIAGERRWRAARLAGLTHVPAIVRQLNDLQAAEWALIENLQREDLNPIERAEAFAVLTTRYAMPHESVAERVGIERSSVTNTLRLLQLEAGVRDLVRQGLLSGGQGKALLAVSDPYRQRQLADQAVKHDWSVRQVEDAVRSLSRAGTAAAPPSHGGGDSAASGPRVGRAAHLQDLEEQIARQLQTKVTIKPGRKKGSGTLSIDFHSIDHFESLLSKLGVKPE